MLIASDTYPLGCKFSEKIVFYEFFADNPDALNTQYQTLPRIYENGCGLDLLNFSWGHDEYLYHVVKDYLPEPALYIIRYHSFYAGHREGGYKYFMNETDKKMFKWLRTFSRYDLYSKGEETPDVKKLQPFYENLIKSYFPTELRW